MKDKIKIYYDGNCLVCGTEMDHYKKKDREGRLDLIDIAGENFNAQKEGLDAQKVQKEMHVRLPNGEIRTGVNAFLAIWEYVPGFSNLSKVVKFPLVKPFAYLGYFIFANIRKYLPKRKTCALTP